uniref:Uncharacterized protein n=1 Tax=Avena sativa TaxID=4498 RepID=A0ACD5YU59_AVESA
MTSQLLRALLPVLLFAGVAGGAGGSGRRGGTPSLEFHHRFSAPVRRWADARGHDLPGGWPAPGGAAYVAALAGHDRHRALTAAGSGAHPPLTFSQGNATLKVSNLGFLHYALVTVGTPGHTFMVALDTGSDLFWLPCQCDGCTPPASGTSGAGSLLGMFLINIGCSVQPFCLLDLYNRSSLVRHSSVCCWSLVLRFSDLFLLVDFWWWVRISVVHCGSFHNNVLTWRQNGQCILTVKKLNAAQKLLRNVWIPQHYCCYSTGLNVDHLILSCGQVQTGSFLDAAAPNGLFGLGVDMISVPSILAQKGFTSDSFSMCFGRDGIGRISFGDQGSSDQAETPLDINQKHPTYAITITGISVGNNAMDLEFSSIFDTGTSFTYLADPAYTYITESFHSQVQANRHAADSRIPFDYCYDLSSSEAKIQTPGISLRTVGGSLFPAIDPGQVISIQQHEYVYCLAIVKSTKLNIIGRKFTAELYFQTILVHYIIDTSVRVFTMSFLNIFYIC